MGRGAYAVTLHEYETQIENLTNQIRSLQEDYDELNSARETIGIGGTGIEYELESEKSSLEMLHYNIEGEWKGKYLDEYEEFKDDTVIGIVYAEYERDIESIREAIADKMIAINEEIAVHQSELDQVGKEYFSYKTNPPKKEWTAGQTISQMAEKTAADAKWEKFCETQKSIYRRGR